MSGESGGFGRRGVGEVTEVTGPPTTFLRHICRFCLRMAESRARKRYGGTSDFSDFTDRPTHKLRLVQHIPVHIWRRKW